MRVDGKFPLPDLRRILFHFFYRNSADAFPKTATATMPSSASGNGWTRWTKVPARDVTFRQPYPLRISLPRRRPPLRVHPDGRRALSGQHHGAETFAPYPAYDSYRQQQKASVSSGFS